MTTMSIQNAVQKPAAGMVRDAGFTAIAGSEWIKLRTVRSTYYSLTAAAFAAVIVAALACVTAVNRWSQMTAAQKAAVDPVRLSFAGWPFTQLLIGVFGALVMTSEYGTGLEVR